MMRKVNESLKSSAKYLYENLQYRQTLVLNFYYSNYK